MFLRMFTILTCFGIASTTVYAQAGFNGSEHLALGDEVVLRFEKNDAGQAGKPLMLMNGLKLTYGEILSLGDFYEIVGQVVSDPVTETERRQRFINAYNSFASQINTAWETRQILAITHEELIDVEEGMRHGEKPGEIYKRVANDHNRRWNCVTGGGCGEYWYLNEGRYLKLALQDLDHFGLGALITYNVGHALAKEQALLAYQTHDKARLAYAYALNAFASHFLSDRFSAGHIRIPRRELNAHVRPVTVGGLLVDFMHNEESEAGLHFHNQRGNQWVGYGDGYYFDRDNMAGAALLREALQLSARDIWQTAMTGETDQVDPALALIPIETLSSHFDLDISPMFYWDAQAGILMRRADLTNVHDYHWTSDWWGWSTLLALIEQRGLPSLTAARLAKSPLAKDPALAAATKVRLS